MTKWLLSVTAIMVAIGGVLIYRAALAGSSLVLRPSQLAQRGAQASLARIRVAGVIAPRPIEYRISPQLELSFSIADSPAGSDGAVPVRYRGVKPDYFSVGRNVLIEGEWSEGTLLASSVLTPCPARYEAAGFSGGQAP